ncbi:7461_t:CDS:2 [Ambispora leptoticha]|uniref:7461_t:CDS:1 n=1 Tax=Ambispora leptoticha TaxID=144679 RepID=A0A9N9HBC3_9GLOM|nr:7461_t:CDS:2 [Ambispora leptoticha]
MSRGLNDELLQAFMLEDDSKTSTAVSLENNSTLTLHEIDEGDAEEDVSQYGEDTGMLLESIEFEEIKKPKDGGSVFESSLLMANSIIGAGIIGLPFSFREAGIWTGLILLLSLTVVVDWTIRLLVLNSKLSGRNSYQDMMYYCFGKSGLIAISVFQFAFAFGGENI